MKRSTVPYSVPSKLEADLARLRAYWEGLKRGDAGMPFWDDVNLTALPDLSGRLMLIDVFEKPLRFRFGTVGEELKERYGADYVGKFSDEIEIKRPLHYVSSQCVATMEGRAPTYYRHEVAKHGSSRAEGYSRLILPMWGDGHIGMLLGAVAWG
jgi:hypothetical protein